ncbi:MAG: hypothetical protein IKH88_16365 [Prevotella sp.]|nr:hypothetical protein [Prevotella sp.]
MFLLFENNYSQHNHNKDKPEGFEWLLVIEFAGGYTGLFERLCVLVGCKGMNIEDGGGNNCKANLRNGVKKWEAKGAFLKGYGLLKGQESRVLFN